MTAIRIALNIGSVALLAVLGVLLVRIGLGLAEPESLYQPDPIVAPTANASSGVSLAAYDFSSDPFSFGEITFDQLDLIEDVPETTLDLKLIGIISESSATFRMSNGKDKPVKVGDEVMNGVILTRTAKEFVMLDVNGDSQKLTLERVKIGEKSETQPIVRAAPKSNLPTKAEIENLFSQVQLTPSLEIMPDRSTRMQGFRIKARSGSDLSKFKLKSGDILTRVGPVMLDTSRVNMKELRDLVSTGAAQDYEVLRDGAPVTIRIGQ